MRSDRIPKRKCSILSVARFEEPASRAGNIVRKKRSVEIGREEAGASNLGDSTAAELLIAAGSMEVGQGKEGTGKATVRYSTRER